MSVNPIAASATSAPSPGNVTMFTTSWCGYCKNLKRQLESLGIPFNLVDIEQDDAAAQFVEQVNGGNRTVPTVLFPDGGALTNPSAAAVKARLANPAAAQPGATQ